MKERERQRGNRERSIEVMKQRMRHVTRRKKQRKANNSASILQRLRFNPTKIPIITTFESPIYRERASFPHQTQSIATSRKKNYRHQLRYAIYLPLSDHWNRFQYVFLHFSRFGYEILLFIEVFCWIGLDLILVQIPFFFPSLSLSLLSNICIHSFFFFFWGFDLEKTF